MLVSATAIATGCARESADLVVLITMDTTRADHLGAYGAMDSPTPHLDAFATEAIRFTDATACAPVTLPSHACMFTGTYPPAHGVRYNGMFRLPESAVTVAERFEQSGWTTAGIPAAFPVAARTGIGQGFGTYLDLFSQEDAESLPIAAERKADETTRLGIEILKKSKGKKLFLWLHYFDPHYVYEPPFPYSAQFRDRPYDGEIAFMDEEIGKFLDVLRNEGRWDDAGIVIVGDHGEGLYEHGEKMHADLVYQSTMHVPLLVKPPGHRVSTVISAPVSGIDVAPTLLALAGIPSGATSPAQNLLELVGGDARRARPIYFESLAGSLVFGWSPLEGIRRGSWKYIRSSESELFDLTSDPLERDNRIDTDGEVASDFDRELQTVLGSMASSEATAERAAAPVDQETLDRLASLGYVGGTLNPTARNGPSPRRLVHLESAILSGRNLMNAGEFRLSLGAWNSILEEDPGNRYALSQATTAARRLHDHALARSYAERWLAMEPSSPEAAVFLGETYVAEGRYGRAAEVFDQAFQLHPRNSGLAYRRCLSLAAAGRLIPAEAALADGLALGEDRPWFLTVQALIQAKQGRGEAAMASLEQAIRDGFRDRVVLENEPVLSPLRSLAGFSSVVSRIREPKG